MYNYYLNMFSTYLPSKQDICFQTS